MQTDPGGYADGMAWYSYAHGDPINGRDPSGMDDDGSDDGGGDDAPLPIEGGALDFIGATTVREGIIVGHKLRPGLYTIQGVPSGNNPATAERGGTGQTRSPQNNVCTGGGVNYSYGAGGTLAFFVGLNLNVSFTLSVPSQINPNSPLQGVQIGFSGQGAPLIGLGAFAGAGEQGGVGYSKGALTSGGGLSIYGEGGAGAGGAVGVSGQANFGPNGSITGGAGGVSGKAGAGIGLYAGGGVAGNASWASHPFGC